MAMIYAYGFSVGAQLLARGNVIPALRHLIQPVSYWRSTEYGLTMRYGDFKASDRVLDIGSPKLLSLYLAKTLGADIYSTDIDGYFMPEYRQLRDIEGLSPERFHVETQDGRNLTYPDNYFDKVYSISVIEHIPDHGDSECMREIGRVLKPGGRAMLTVPFGSVSQDQYRSGSSFYWSSVSTKSTDDSVFFQRKYTEQDLQERLIGPSGLRVAQRLFVGERVFTNSDKEFFEHLPSLTHPLIGPIQAPLARVLQTPATASAKALKKPLCAFLMLEKPANA
jgi:SAM-dependent methyltransferase